MILDRVIQWDGMIQIYGLTHPLPCVVAGFLGCVMMMGEDVRVDDGGSFGV